MFSLQRAKSYKRKCPSRKAVEPPKLTSSKKGGGSKVASSNAKADSNATIKKRSAESLTTQGTVTENYYKRNTRQFNSSGYGVFISEKTRWTCLQNGSANGSRVITTGNSKLKSSAIVTRDLGFTPTSRKWNGKNIVTQEDLLHNRAQKQSQTKVVAVQQPIQQPSYAQPTASQRQ